MTIDSISSDGCEHHMESDVELQDYYDRLLFSETNAPLETNFVDLQHGKNDICIDYSVSVCGFHRLSKGLKSCMHENESFIGLNGKEGTHNFSIASDSSKATESKESLSKLSNPNTAVKRKIQFNNTTTAVTTFKDTIWTDYSLNILPIFRSSTNMTAQTFRSSGSCQQNEYIENKRQPASNMISKSSNNLSSLLDPTINSSSDEVSLPVADIKEDNYLSESSDISVDSLFQHDSVKLYNPFENVPQHFGIGHNFNCSDSLGNSLFSQERDKDNQTQSIKTTVITGKQNIQNYLRPAAQDVQYLFDHTHNGKAFIVKKDGRNIPNIQLRLLYQQYGQDYFYSEDIFCFVDYLKKLILDDTTNEKDSPKKMNIRKFVQFLKECDSNPYLSGVHYISNKRSNNVRERPNESVRASVVLAATKRGRLVLLSRVEDQDLQLCRGDVTIIEGDRGKDMAIIVEPEVDFHLALFMHFMIKKISTDAIINPYDNHHPSYSFIEDLMEDRKLQTNKLPGFYDVLNLTQFVLPPKRVLSFANVKDITIKLRQKKLDEEVAQHVVNEKLEKVNQRTYLKNGIPGYIGFNIMDVEYQFSPQKVILRYYTKERKEFGPLTRELFKYFKTRIWFDALPNNVCYQRNSNSHHIQIYHTLIDTLFSN
ncbi:hypothetical protein KAFR_0D04070 [Kazachstania africana CBS 2517]|uniref:PSP1 C-terminal domain-containing protein n=1 Tax=Kazachstania africana (strain ATCC 22294 / BCRC 22015 / CBS 2517 / CECT 1963 / NBRC 1671 / NRRL Y-8276) TaxID=1071382 RepID=H2AUK5_KAZAF|nr:hypothetical protein KAFR_0D04070 [Kazachstania africana CBS 2517]CCF58055.1 hypothetical protein KAFR_0D04070 [Kazachstania africana CBS 2517]